MKDNSESSLDALLRAARGEAADTSRLEYGFETRLMARLREDRGTSLFSWAWRLCPFFAVLAVSAAIWSRSTTARVETDATVVAEAVQSGDETVLMAFMTGDRR